MSTIGALKGFIDYTQVGADSGTVYPGSINGIQSGQDLDGRTPGVDEANPSTGNLGRAPENLRQRTEALRKASNDTLFLRDADRAFALGGPGLVTWGGSLTTLGTGVLSLSDVLFLLPMLTPGSPQVSPVPPVASMFGTIKLQKVGPAAGLVVTSRRRSYEDGDQISIEVVSGGSFSVAFLDFPSSLITAPARTIRVTAVTGVTTLLNVINALNALTADNPATQLVTAALDSGAANGDFILSTQAKQFMSGNYDGEGHVITPAALATFFTTGANKLDEGDTLCVQYASLVAAPTDSDPIGGRRQSIPENSNTSLPAGSFFNSRVNPERLINALPVCKVVNNRLVFLNGNSLPVGASMALFSRQAADVSYAGGGNWADGTANPATTVEAQLDKIITDLGSGNGAAKIQYNGGGNWADGTTNPAATVDAQVDKIISDLASSGGSKKINFDVVNGIIAGRICMYTTGDNAVTIEPFGITVGGLTLASSGFSLAAEVTGLTHATLYYIYAFVQSGGVAVEVVTTVPDSASGFRTKTGDSTKVYLGSVYIMGGAGAAAGKVMAFRRNGRRTVFQGDVTQQHAPNPTVPTENYLGSTTTLLVPTDFSLAGIVPPWVNMAHVLVACIGGSTGVTTVSIKGKGPQVTNYQANFLNTDSDWRGPYPVSLNGTPAFTIDASGNAGIGVWIHSYED